jgi:hypothetical protein
MRLSEFYFRSFGRTLVGFKVWFGREAKEIGKNISWKFRDGNIVPLRSFVELPVMAGGTAE